MIGGFGFALVILLLCNQQLLNLTLDISLQISLMAAFFITISPAATLSLLSWFFRPDTLIDDDSARLDVQPSAINDKAVFVVDAVGSHQRRFGFMLAFVAGHRGVEI